MTATQIAKDAAFYVRTQPISRRDWPVSDDTMIARVDRVQADGQYDRDDQNLRRSREGQVGDARMMCQVATLRPDTLMLFWALGGDGHQRLLVDGAGKTWMDADGRAVALRENNKYFASCQAILRAWAN